MKDWRLKNHDWIMTATIFILMFIGLVVIYSATFSAKTEIEGVGTINRQLVFAILGFFIYFAVSRIDPTFYRYFPIQFAIITIIVGLLLFVWLFGDPVHNTNRWIEWGFIRIQPSEYAKIALILLNASILADVLQLRSGEEVDWGKRKILKKTKRISKSFRNFTSLYPVLYRYGLAFTISGLVIAFVLVEPALGNAAIIALICISLFIFTFPKQKYILGFFLIGLIILNLFIRSVTFEAIYEKISLSLIVEGLDIGVLIISMLLVVTIIFTLRLKVLSVIIFAGLITFIALSISFIWNQDSEEHQILKPYQKERIETFLNPEKDTKNAGWQLRQSRIAIGSGRLLGKGFLHGSQSKLRYLPEAYNDFIFAAFAEEFGLVGSITLLLIYIFLFTRIIKASIDASDSYKSLMCIGVLVLLFVHVFINTGMNMGILPITGIPLPLISYGGSSVMVTMIALGLVQSVNTHKDIVDMQGDLVLTSKSSWRDN